MEISSNNNNGQITISEESSHLIDQPIANPISILSEDRTETLITPGLMMKSLQSTKSKKSLKSIVDRLSKQYGPLTTDSQQFMAALSLTETSRAALMYQGQVHNFQHSTTMNDEALDLSLKRPPNVGQREIEETFPNKTDSIGALDLSVSSSRDRSIRRETGSESPDFVLDLTKPTPLGRHENENKIHWVLKSQNNVETVVNPPKESPKDEQDDFQANHMRVLQFLSNHTFQQKVSGTDVNIELLTCRYCKYASTEKSCMMAHLTTTHVSKKHSGSSRVRHSPYHRLEMKPEHHRHHRQPSQSNGSSPRHATRKQKGETPHLVMINNDQGSYSPQLLQVVDGNSQLHHTVLPASLVELAAPSSNVTIPRVPQTPRHVRSPKKSSRTARNASPQRRRSRPNLYDNQRNLVSTGEDRVYFIPYQPAGSILEERLMLSQGNASSTDLLPSTSGSDQLPKSAESVTTSSSEEQQRLKLNHLCTKLANRMGIRNHRSKVYRGNNQGTEENLRSTPKGRRRKSSGGKRQSLIAQTGNFSCEYCSKTFKRPLSLYGHLKQHSPLLKKHRKGLFQCRTCPLTFSSFSDLLQHTQNKHSQIEIAKEDNKGSSISKETSSKVDAKFLQEGYTGKCLSAETVKKSGRSRKTKPYSLREQARRDYLLDHDPMVDQKDVDFMSSWQENGTRSLVAGTDMKMSPIPESTVVQKQQVKLKRVSKDAKHLIRLKKARKKKARVANRTSEYALGFYWKRVLKKFKIESKRQQVANVFHYFVRRPKDIQCKLCDESVRTFWKALLHFQKRHIKKRRKTKCGSKGSKLQVVDTSKSPDMVELDMLSTVGSSDTRLYVKMSGTGEQYQCNLCLQLFKGRDALIQHLEMHKQIYEEGMKTFSNNSGRGSTKKRKVNARGEAALIINPEDQLPLVVDSVLERSQGSGNGHMSSNNHSLLLPDVKLSPHEVANMNESDYGPSQLTEDSGSPVVSQKKKLGSPSKGKQLKKHLFESSLQSGRKSEKLLCKICMFQTLALEEMKRHMRKHCKTLLNCDQCSYQTIERRFIVRHIQTVHEQRRPFTCELCVYSTAYKHHLKRHYKSHSVELLACSMCSFCTLQEGKFQEHMKEHDLSPNIVMCDDCGLTFANDKILKEHRAETHNKQACEEKEEATSEPKDRAGCAANWWENISTATLDKEAIFEQHRCDACGFFAEDNNTLMNHMLTEHINVVAFKEEQKDVTQVQNQLTMDLSVQCPQCGFITSNDQLKAHLETHNSDETYACEHCPYETKSLDALQKHKGKHIKHKVSLTCLQCGQIQTDILSLRDHTRIHLVGVDDDNLFRCSLCAFMTNSSEDGEYHLDQHNYVMEFKCQVCMYSSPTLSGLTSHRRLHRKLKATTYTQKKGSPTKSHESQ